MRNKLINGDFSIWQRGTEFVPQGHLLYTADRWNVDWQHGGPTLGTARISRQRFTPGQTDVPGNPKYFLRWKQETQSNGTPFRDLSQQVEEVSTFAGERVTLSCYLRSDVPTTVRLVTEQFFGSGGGGSPPEFTESQIFHVTPTWKRYSYSPTLKSVAGTQLGPNGDDSLNFIVSQRGQSAVDILTLDVADCQLELGDTLTRFERLTVGQQLVAAERYFQKSYSFGTPPGVRAWESTYNTRQVSRYNVAAIHLRQSMRIPPTVTLFNPETAAVGTWRSLSKDVAVTVGDVGTNYFHVDATNGIDAEPLAGHWIADAEYSGARWWT